MIVSAGRARALALALLALSLFVVSTAEAQLPEFGARLHLFRDNDSSGDASCGDQLHSRVIISSRVGAQDLTNLSVTIPVPAGSTIIPGTTTVAFGPESTCSLIQGDQVGHSHIVVFCPFLCMTGGSDPGTCSQVGLDVQAMLVIDEPNTNEELLLRGVADADQIEPTQSTTDILTFTPCPADVPPILEATLVDQPAHDHDGDGAVDAGESIVYTLIVTNTGGTRADEVLVQMPPPQHTSLHRGSVTTSLGVVTLGNGFGDQTVEVAIAALEPGQSATIVFGVAVGLDLEGVFVLSGQGALSAANASPGVTDDPDLPGLFDPTLTPVDRDPDLRLSVQPIPPTAGAGERITWELLVANDGGERAGGVTVTTAVPLHTTFDAAASDTRWSCAGSAAGSACAASLGGLPVSAQTLVPFVVRVVPQLAADAFLTTLAAAVTDNGAAGPDLDPSNNQAQASADLVGEPELVLAKAGPASARPGEQLVYGLTYENGGTRDTFGARLEETVPAHTVFAAGSSTAGWSCADGAPAGSSCSFEVGDLPAGGSGTVAFAVRLPQTVPADADQVTNTATLGDGAGGPPASATRSTSIVAAPELVLAKLGPAVIGVDDLLVYTLEASNQGDRDATGVRLFETVPGSTSFVAADSAAGWSCADGAGPGTACELALGGLAAGAGPTAVRFAGRVDPTVAAGVEHVRNTAVLRDDGSQEVTATVETPLDAAVELALSKAGPSSAQPGDQIVYNLTYRNAGTRDTVGAHIVETVPPHTSFLADLSAADWSCADGAPAGSSCRYDVGDLAAGASASVTFAVTIAPTVPAGAEELTNTATLRDGAGSPPATDTQSTSIVAAPELVLAKLGPAAIGAGELLVYVLEAANTGDRDAAAVVIAETVPGHTTFVAAESAAGWSCADGAGPETACELALGGFAAGAPPTSVRFAVRVDSSLGADVEHIVNTATLRDDGSPEVPTTVETPVDAAPALALSKSAPASARPGDVLLYTLSYANDGDQAAAGAMLVESVPELGSFEESQSTGSWTCLQPVGEPVACSLQLGDLAAGQSGEATFAVRLASSVPAALTEVANTASLRAFGTEPAEAAASTVVDAAPHLTLTKSGPAEVAPGERLVYSLAYANQGDRDAVDVALVETVPQHTAFDAGGSSPGWSCADGSAAGTSCRLAFGDLPAEASGTAAFAVVVGTPPPGVGAIVNSALLVDGGGSPPGEGGTTTPVTGAAGLTLTKSGPALAQPGEVLVYELAYANAGDRPAVGVSLGETVPEHTTYSAGASSPGWSCADGAAAGSACALVVGDLAPSASGVAVFAVALADPVPADVAQVSNTAVLSEEGGSPPVESKVETPVDTGGPGPVGEPVLAWLIDTVIEDDGDGLIGAGDVIGYTLHLEAVEAVADVVVRVPPDPATELLVGTVTTTVGAIRVGDVAGDTVPEVGFGDLAAGATATMTFEVLIVDPVPSGLEFIAAQGDVLSGADPVTVSDDPDTVAVLDPTVTELDTPADAIVEIPTLDHVGLALLVLVIAGAAFARLRRVAVG